MLDSSSYPYRPGEAVYYLQPLATPYQMPILTPAVVTKVHRTTATILRSDSLRRVVSLDSLIYRGYCGACQLPAIDRDGRLYCPRCCQLATPDPPPDVLALRWLPVGHEGPTRVVREFLIARCTSWHEGWERVYTHDGDALILMLRQTGLYERWRAGEPMPSMPMKHCAIRGDVAGFLAAYEKWAGRAPEAPPTSLSDGSTAIAEQEPELDNQAAGDGPGSPSRRLPLPPVTITRPTDDSEPDGVDELTAWLDQQFKRAA